MKVDTNTMKEQLYYTESGEGTPVFFIHGNLSTGMDTFSLQMDFFSDYFRCICPDLRCHGKSYSVNTFWTPENLSEDIIRMMDNLKIDKAHFVGHSMGGDILMYILLNHIDRALTAVSICSGGSTNNSIISYMRRFDPDKMDPDRHRDFIDQIKREHETATAGDWKGFLRHTIWNCENFPGFSDDEMRRMDRPFLLIRGKKDHLVKDHEVDRLKALIPDFHMIEADGGHTLTKDENTAAFVNSSILEFIQKSQGKTP